jgi:hypothetical protein
MPKRASAKAAKKKRPKKRNRRPRQLRDGPKLTGKNEKISLHPLSWDEAMKRLIAVKTG